MNIILEHKRLKTKLDKIQTRLDKESAKLDKAKTIIDSITPKISNLASVRDVIAAQMAVLTEHSSRAA